LTKKNVLIIPKRKVTSSKTKKVVIVSESTFTVNPEVPEAASQHFTICGEHVKILDPESGSVRIENNWESLEEEGERKEGRRREGEGEGGRDEWREGTKGRRDEGEVQRDRGTKRRMEVGKEGQG
jgi:hypothetical protein